MWTSHSPPFPWTENEDESVIVYTFLRKMLVFAAKGIARRCSLSCRQWDLPAVSWYFLVCHDFLDFSRYFLIACFGTCRVGWWKCWKKLEFEDSHTTMIDKGMTLNRSMVTNCQQLQVLSGSPRPFYWAGSGDFVLASRRLILEVHGYPEAQIWGQLTALNVHSLYIWMITVARKWKYCSNQPEQDEFA